MSSHLVGYLLKRQSGSPWVADFQDPWTENYFDDIPTVAHARMARWLETIVVRSADCITVTTDRHRQILLRRYPFLRNNRLRVVPLGFHEEDFDRTVLPTERAKFTLTHFGNFHSTRSPVALLNAVAGCCAARPSFALETRVSFLGAFDVDSWRALTRIVNERHLQANVDVRGIVDYSEGLRYLKDSDVLLLIMDDSGWGRNMTPCKLFDYLPTRRPILALTPPGDVPVIESTLLYLYDRWKQGLLLLDSDARYIDGFEWKNVTRKFTCVLDDVVSHAIGIHKRAGPSLCRHRSRSC
jgi:hypothetical protein